MSLCMQDFSCDLFCNESDWVFGNPFVYWNDFYFIFDIFGSIIMVLPILCMIPFCSEGIHLILALHNILLWDRYHSFWRENVLGILCSLLVIFDIEISSFCEVQNICIRLVIVIIVKHISKWLLAVFVKIISDVTLLFGIL